MLSFTFWSGLLLVAAQLLAAFLFPEQLWGLHHLAFFPAPVPVLLVLTTALLLLWARYGSSAWIERVLAAPWKQHQVALIPCASLCLLAIFYFFRIRHLLLGDAAIVNQLEQIPPVFAWLGKNDPLIHSLLYNLLTRWFPLEIWSVFVLVSCVAGAVFSVAAIRVANTGEKHRGSRLFVFVVLTGTGAMELFCGYVEYYTLMSLFLALALFSLMYWQGKRTWALLLAVLSWLAAFMLHPIASCLGPAIALAVGFHLWKSPWPAPKRLTVLGLLGVGSLGGVAYWLFHVAASQPLLLSPSQAYPLFGTDHLKDALNEYLLLVPLHGPLILFLLWRQRRALSWQDPVLVCLGMAAAASWGTSFLIDPLLGSLDWDLLSVYAFPVTALTAYLVGRQVDGSLDTLRSGLCFAAASLLHVLPWVSANTDVQRAGRMVEAMAAHDPHHRGYRNTVLGVKLQEMGLTEAAIRQYEKAIAVDKDNYLAYNNLAWCYLALKEEGCLEHAMALFERFVATAPHTLDTRMTQGILALHAGQMEEGVRLCTFFLLSYQEQLYAQSTFSQLREFAGSLIEQLPQERLQEVLRVGISFSYGDVSQALVLGRDLVKQYPDDPLVLEVTDLLRQNASALLRQQKETPALP